MCVYICLYKRIKIQVVDFTFGIYIYICMYVYNTQFKLPTLQVLSRFICICLCGFLFCVCVYSVVYRFRSVAYGICSVI